MCLGYLEVGMCSLRPGLCDLHIVLPLLRNISIQSATMASIDAESTCHIRKLWMKEGNVDIVGLMPGLIDLPHW